MSKPLVATVAMLLLGVGVEEVADTSAPEARSASISGHVTVSAPTPPPPTSLSPYARRRYRPPQSPGVPGGAEDAVVYLEAFDGPRPAPTERAVRILQRERTITPHVSVAQVGQRVEFPNDDDVFHNIFSLSPGNGFSLGRYAPGVTETNRFERPGTVQLFCDIHAEMAGVILVVATPYVAQAGAGGAFDLRDVPPGRYRAIAWHPSAGADTTELSLGDGEHRTVDFSLRAAR